MRTLTALLPHLVNGNARSTAGPHDIRKQRLVPDAAILAQAAARRERRGLSGLMGVSAGGHFQNGGSMDG